MILKKNAASKERHFYLDSNENGLDDKPIKYS
jgi:hypothetical protein